MWLKSQGMVLTKSIRNASGNYFINNNKNNETSGNGEWIIFFQHMLCIVQLHLLNIDK